MKDNKHDRSSHNGHALTLPEPLFAAKADDEALPCLFHLVSRLAPCCPLPSTPKRRIPPPARPLLHYRPTTKSVVHMCGGRGGAALAACLPGCWPPRLPA